MELNLDPSSASGYSSNAQIARIVTEKWAAENLYRLACPSRELVSERNNSPVRDFTCPSCTASYQLKGKNGGFGRSVSNSAYAQKIAAIDRGAVPHYAFLNYSRTSWTVTNLFVVPGHLIGRSVVQPRKPLGSGARRAGWVGSNIRLGHIPEHGRISVISEGLAKVPSQVRREWNKVAFIAANPKASQGWGADVFSCITRLAKESGSKDFTLKAFTSRFLADLSQLHPENHNVAAKIRQQMQVLRDSGLLEFVNNRGRYRLSD